MENDHVVSGLMRKRAELAGQIEHTQTVLRQMVIDLDHIDATLRLFAPDIDLQEIKPKPLPPKHHAFRGEITRIVLECLRQSGPLTSHDLAQHVMAERGLDTADRRLVMLVGKRVGACLRHQKRKGLVRVVPGPGPLQRWSISCAPS